MVFRILLKFLARPYYSCLYRLCKVGEYDGICIADITAGQPLKHEFVKHVTQALEIVGAKDSRRYRRIRRNIRFIVHRELRQSVGGYRRRPPTCSIDLAKYLRLKTTKKQICRRLAATLVHEATHGEVLRRGIPLTPENKVRMERISFREEIRFAHRVDSMLGAAYQKTYGNTTQWQQRYGELYRPSAFQRLLSRWRRWLSTPTRGSRAAAVQQLAEPQAHPASAQDSLHSGLEG